MLLRENEKLKNDLRANRKNILSAGQPPAGGPPNQFSAMIGKATYEKYGGGVNKSTVLGPGTFGAGGMFGAKGDGSGTDRSTYYQPIQYGAPKEVSHHGAVSALNLAGAGLAGGGQHLDASYVMKNILSTPSSGKSKSGISQEDALDLQKQP